MSKYFENMKYIGGIVFTIVIIIVILLVIILVLSLGDMLDYKDAPSYDIASLSAVHLTTKSILYNVILITKISPISLNIIDTLYNVKFNQWGMQS